MLYYCLWLYVLISLIWSKYITLGLTRPDEPGGEGGTMLGSHDLRLIRAVYLKKDRIKRTYNVLWISYKLLRLLTI